MHPDIRDILSKPAISPVEYAKVMNIGRASAYAACSKGEIETIRCGKLIKVPTAPLRRALGLES